MKIPKFLKFPFVVMLSFMLVFTQMPILALADGNEPPAETTAEALERLADEAQTAAGAAKDALDKITTNGVDTDGDGDGDTGLEDVAEEALKATEKEKGEADTALADSLDTDAAQNAINAIADADDEAEILAAIADAEDAINKVIADAENAIAAAQDVVDAAEKVIAIAEEAESAAKEAVEAANKALAKAEEADKLYQGLLQEAVTGDPATYAALAEAENTMTAAWNDYTDAQNIADGLANAAHQAKLDVNAAADDIADAISAANKAQADANDLLQKWVDAEKAMQDALTATDDTDLAALEAYRQNAKNSALAAMANARAANEKAVDIYLKARAAAGLANDAVDAINKANWGEDSLIADLETAVEDAAIPGTVPVPIQPVDPTAPTVTLPRIGGTNGNEITSDVYDTFPTKHSSNSDVVQISPGITLNSTNGNGEWYIAVDPDVKDEYGNSIFIGGTLTFVWKGKGTDGNSSNRYFTATITIDGSKTKYIIGPGNEVNHVKVGKYNTGVRSFESIDKELSDAELGGLTLEKLNQLATLDSIVIPEEKKIEEEEKKIEEEEKKIEEEEEEEEEEEPTPTPTPTPTPATEPRERERTVYSAAAANDVIDIIDEATPLAENIPEPLVEELLEIPEEEVPLANLPKTGVNSLSLMWGLGGLLALVGGLMIGRKSKKEC